MPEFFVSNFLLLQNTQFTLGFHEHLFKLLPLRGQVEKSPFTLSCVRPHTKCILTLQLASFLYIIQTLFAITQPSELGSDMIYQIFQRKYGVHLVQSLKDGLYNN